MIAKRAGTAAEDEEDKGRPFPPLHRQHLPALPKKTIKYSAISPAVDENQDDRAEPPEDEGRGLRRRGEGVNH
ncbi:hypothetical protein VPNG_00692 [Cytospora leucostoma]|uniref:Uncharacterized protein n=1 Tax=Cytospora leucostoma TaxID=1230097 RepID=A0A423XLV9_9PEZI|nr:hypothetical protein VPNG_00692 [Cytospora leucostoma]